MKRSAVLSAVAALASVMAFAGTANAQNVGDSVVLSFQADNASSAGELFPGARRFDVLAPTVDLTVGAYSFTANTVSQMQVIDSAGTGGFPFNDEFSSGSDWSLNDPNFDVHDALAEDLRIGFFMSSDAAFHNIINSNLLIDLIGNTYNASQFGDDPSFPFENFDLEISYTPDFLSSSESLTINFSDISFEQGSLGNLVKVTINGTVATNDIVTPGTSLAIPEPATMALLLAGGVIAIRRRRA